MSRPEDRRFEVHPDMVGRLRRVGAAMIADGATVLGELRGTASNLASSVQSLIEFANPRLAEARTGVPNPIGEIDDKIDSLQRRRRETACLQSSTRCSFPR